VSGKTALRLPLQMTPVTVQGRRATVTRCVRMAGSVGRGRAGCRRLEQDAASLRTIRRRRRERSHHRRESPFLDVRFDEDESSLTEVDVHAARAVRADRRKHVALVEPDKGILELFPVPSEEDSSGPRTIADAECVAFEQRRSVRSGGKGERV
jgi:hypothetical protein